MKIAYASDLHLEYDFRFRYPPFDLYLENCRDADVIVLAGDIVNSAFKARSFIESLKPHCPVLYVLGNHEFYGGEYNPQLYIDVMNESEYDIRVLENDVAIIDGVHFVGATLWTDFMYHKALKDGMDSFYLLNDPVMIRDRNIKLSAERVLQIHKDSIFYIEDYCNHHKHAKRVVITHHGVHSENNRGYESSVLSPSFVSDMEYIFMRDDAPEVWISGHTHVEVDKQIGNTRLLSNPRGYSSEFNIYDKFDWKVFDV